MKIRFKRIIITLLVIAVVGLSTFYLFRPQLEKLYGYKDINKSLPVNEEPKNPPPPPNPVVTLAAVGDVMMHEGQILSGYDSAKQLYDYSYFFEDIKPEIESADISMVNLETTLAGKERKFTGYPMFNSPDELADALKQTGFDIVVTSNNHSLDRGEQGVIRTLEVLRDRGLSTVGTYDMPELRNTVLVKEVNGMKLSFLAYTYGTNGIPIPQGKPYLVNLIDKEVILNDIAEARKLSDGVIVYLHFGQEYQLNPSAEQKNLAEILLNNGADVVIGSHPHVLQPGEWVEVKEADGSIAKKYAAYSLGNFISAQRFPHTEEGMILKITLEKDLAKNKIITKHIEEIPTWVDKFKINGKMRYVVRLGEKV